MVIIMDYKAKYQQWLTDEFFNESTRKELLAIKDEKEIEDRFYKYLEFGTGGLRGVMGAGTNRMNKYTVGKATKGLGEHLLATYDADVCAGLVGVCVKLVVIPEIIACMFAKTAADVLSGKGKRVYLHSHARPTPQHSFSVKFWNAVAGIVLTASHNPKEYNGYKVYDEYGCQLVPHKAKKIISYVNAVTDYHSICFVGNNALISMADVIDNFIAATMKQSRYSGDKNLPIIHTPLHGTGNMSVQKRLRLAGFKNVDTVAEQVVPDGNFPTVVSPNPEDRKELEMGIAQDERSGAEIAKKHGLTVFSTLTGIKFIGEKITQFQQAKATGDTTRDYTFLFGYEESYGYLVGTHARDKDAVVFSLLICEMVAQMREQSKTLFDRMNELYEEYGYYRDALDSFTLKG